MLGAPPPPLPARTAAACLPPNPPTTRASREASAEQRAFLLKRAGDVCVGLGEPRKALGWYGRAVDQHLELKQLVHAETLCRMIIYVEPNAVRARCTLTWIAIGEDRLPEAAEQLAAYVDAA